MNYLNLYNLQTIKVNDDSLIDFWFKLNKKDEGIKYTPRLKQMRLKNMLNNKDKLKREAAIYSFENFKIEFEDEGCFVLLKI